MTDHLQRLIEYQDRKIKKEMGRKEEIELITEMRDSNEFNTSIEINTHYNSEYRLTIEADEITKEIKELLQFNIVGDTELNFTGEKLVMRAKLNFDPDTVAYEMRT